ncbi:MAG: CDP-archaeol synthase [Patescibacteria group bacterium]|nr:CDP-archaeol synthase [Patescibacteria group bacterium]
MEAIIIYILKITWYSLPLGLANMMPVIFNRWFGFLAKPVDFSAKIKNQRLFGAHKTWRGILAALIGGALIFIIQKHAFVNSDFFRSISIINYSEKSIWMGTIMALGAIIGDLVKSFFKRRLNIKSGHSWIPFDQIDYTLGGMIFSFPFFIPPADVFVSLVALGFIFHIGINIIGKFIGLRRKAF